VIGLRVSYSQNDATLSRNSLRYPGKANLPIAVHYSSCRASLRRLYLYIESESRDNIVNIILLLRRLLFYAGCIRMSLRPSPTPGSTFGVFLYISHPRVVRTSYPRGVNNRAVISEASHRWGQHEFSFEGILQPTMEAIADPWEHLKFLSLYIKSERREGTVSIPEESTESEWWCRWC